MTAGVHPPGPGGKVQASLLGDRQRIHIRPQQHRGTVPGATAQHRGDRRQRPPGRDLQRRALQPGQHPLLGTRKIQAKLRVAAQAHQRVLQRQPLRPPASCRLPADHWEPNHSQHTKTHLLQRGQRSTEAWVSPAGYCPGSATPGRRRLSPGRDHQGQASVRPAVRHRRGRRLQIWSALPGSLTPAAWARHPWATRARAMPPLRVHHSPGRPAPQVSDGFDRRC